MDSLTNFILRELAFEGDLGSDLSRLRELISQYYTTHHPELHQNVDDKLCAFVWTLLVTQDSVIVGLAPNGAAAVYFPPQLSASRKGKEKAQEDIAVSLAPLASDEFTSTPLDILVERYGSGLRIAVTPETCFTCITGSHIRPPKLSGTVYAVLQLITRTRRDGISVVEISRQSGYDAKTCFYLIRILVELGHIHKIKVGGSTGNICIHRAFYDDECEWKQAEKEAGHEPKQEESRPASAAVSDAEDDSEGKEFRANVRFDPLDNRHLSNLGLIKARLEKLLRHMPNGIHIYRNLVFAIGFDTTNKKERRIFTHRVHELIKSRFIEKVWASSVSSKSGRVLCVRLVPNGSTTSADDIDIAEPGAGDDPKGDDDLMDDDPMSESAGELEEYSEGATQEMLTQFEGAYATQTTAYQIISLVEQSGPRGMTIAEISKCMHNFDPRSVTSLIARFSGGIPPTHLADRGLKIATEMYGRERRQRIYTSAGYRSMIEREGHEVEPVTGLAEDLAHAGGWAVFEKEEFTADEHARQEWLQEFIKTTLVNGGEKAKDKAKGKKKRTNPLDANGKPIIGRPRKEWTAGKRAEKNSSKKRGRPPKRKAEETEDVAEPPVVKKRGRSPKAKPEQAAAEAESTSGPVADNTVDKPAQAGPSTVKPVTRNQTKKKQVAANPPVSTSQQMEPTLQAQIVSVDDVAPSTADAARGSLANSSEATAKIKGSKKSERLKKAQEARSSSGSQSISVNPDSASPSRPLKRARIETRADPVDIGVGPTAVTQDTPMLPIEPPTPSLDELTRIGPKVQVTQLELPTPSAVNGSSAVPTGENPAVVRVSQVSAPTGSRQGRPANVSSLRRQTEFQQVLEGMGGVVNISVSKAFNDEHQRLLETLHASGKPVSTTPGTGMDRRTFTSTISALESRGLVKTLVVSTVTPLGATRRATILHLPGASADSIEACVTKFRESSLSSKGAPIVNDHPSLPGAIPSPRRTRTSARVLPQEPPVPTQVPEPSQDPLVPARHTHLTDVMTAAQHVGYIVGRFSRARILHLRLLSEIASTSPPGTIISPGRRIISKDYFFNSIPLSTYFAIIPQGSVIPGLKELLDAEGGGEIRIGDAPANIQSHLRPRSSANRSRMHKNLLTLVGLGCLAPVQLELNANTQVVKYMDPTSDEAQWDYFKVTESVPIYRFADRDLEAPFCYNQEVPNVDAGIRLWERLHTASHLSTCDAVQSSNSEIRYSGDPKLLKAIRRSTSWKAEYMLSTTQVDHLNGLIDTSTGLTPLDDQESTRFDNACFVTAAPANAVAAFFTQKRADIQRDLDRVRLTAQKQANDQRSMEAEARYALVVKAAQAKKDQEARWESIVAKALDDRVPSHPQLQKALATLQSAYMLAPQSANTGMWQAKVREAVRDTLGARQFVIAPPQIQNKPFSAQQEPDTEISTLILRQGQPIVQKDVAPKKAGRKSKKQPDAEMKEVSENIPASEADLRRRRFPWSAEYDEMARDAGAIIRVRCQGKRMDWSALEQVFPGVQRNSVRQRISSLETLPGATSYYRRLDEAWAKLWLQYRGSDALPDPNPDSLSDFDLAAHINFLREHIDKLALRAGSDLVHMDTTNTSFALESVDELYANYIVNEKPLGPHPVQPTTWDFYFEVTSEEPREREFLQHPCVVHDSLPNNKLPPAKVSVAQAAIKMVMSTPDSAYDSNVATTLLRHFGEHAVEAALEGMKDSLDSKRMRVDKREPGRKYTFSDLDTLRLKGDFASSMYPDAAATREHLDNLEPGEWMNINLIDEDGEVAAYLQLISDNMLDINIDTAIPRAGREHIAWQSKKVDDENLEAQLSIRLISREIQSVTTDDKLSTNQPENLEQMPSSDIRASCPHVLSDGSICKQCLQARENSLSAPSQLYLVRALHDAGPPGLPISEAMDILKMDPQTLLQILPTLTEATPPLAYVLGYDQARIVSAFHLSEWTVQVTSPAADSSQTRPKLVFPRRWLDIYGRVIESVWTMALRTVAGAFMYRPSMSEHTLRTRYQGLFDRQELNDILRQLLFSGKLKRVSTSPFSLGMTSLDDEETTYWSLSNEDHWF